MQRPVVLPTGEDFQLHRNWGLGIQTILLTGLCTDTPGSFRSAQDVGEPNGSDRYTFVLARDPSFATGPGLRERIGPMPGKPRDTNNPSYSALSNIEHHVSEYVSLGQDRLRPVDDPP